MSQDKGLDFKMIWDSLICQSKDYGTQVTAKALELLVELTYSYYKVTKTAVHILLFFEF